MSFRSKLVLAFLALLVPTLAIVLVSVNHQTDAQVRQFTVRTIQRANQAFAEAERSNRGQLEIIGQRFASGPRISALVQSSLFDVDTAFVAEQLRYELKLSGYDSALVVLTNLQGRPIAGIAQGKALRDLDAGIPLQLFDTLFARGDTAAFGYHRVVDSLRMGDRLYTVYVALIRVVDQPTGFVIVGQPIDRNMAVRLGAAVDGEMCFVAGTRCLASTPGVLSRGLEESVMVAATRAPRSTRVSNGKRWLLLSDALEGGAGWRVIARPLDEILAPLERIRSVLLRVGLFALALAPILAILFARGLVRPIRALVAATGRIAHGDYTAHVPVASRDEIGTLSVAFNEMADGLLLKEKYRGLLDKVISPEIADEMLKSEISLGGENREVTILFADIRGFTPFTEGMEPQNVIRVLNDAMERASAVVDREGGVVDKYIGDEIMALFGAPLARPDDALRAVRAAVGIRDAIASLGIEGSKHGDRKLAVGVGVNTGIVVAGNMGSERRLNYTVLGEAVNVAARLCSQAVPGQILIGDQTYQAVAARVAATHAGSLMLKGLSQPLDTYSVTAVHD